MAPRTENGPGAPTPPATRRGLNTLTRSQRLTASRAFQDTFDQNFTFAGRLLVLRLRRGPDAALRLGVVVGKRTFPRSVDRSRMKRLMREAYRLNRRSLSGVADVVLTARGAMRGASRQDVERDLMAQARRAGLAGRSAGETGHAERPADRRS